MASLRPQSKRGGALALALLLLGSTAHLSTSPAVAEPGRYRDFWADAYGDGLDFDSPEDIVVADDGPMMGLTNPVVADGKLSFTVDRPGYFSPLWGGYLDAIPHGREGSLHPIDASRYEAIVIRMRADEPIDAGVRWYSCRAGVAEFCQGGFNFRAEAGWVTYVLRMKNQAADPALNHAAWAGMISGLRIAFGDAKNNKVDVDYIRLIAPDDNGVLDGNFDITSTLTRPEWRGPADPTPAKGLDYTDVARKGDRWVFDSKGDLKSSGNATNVVVVGGALQGDSAPSTTAAPGDSFILLPLGTPLPKLSDFHNVAIKMKLDGPYSQQFKKGGGTAVRLRIKLKGSTRYLLTRPIAIYPSDEWLTFDLADRFPLDGNPGQLGDIIDPAYSKAAKHTTAASEMTQDDIDFDAAPGDYSSLNLDQPVIAFGIDPTEDYGQRHFVIDAVHLYSGPKTIGTTTLFTLPQPVFQSVIMTAPPRPEPTAEFIAQFAECTKPLKQLLDAMQYDKAAIRVLPTPEFGPICRTFAPSISMLQEWNTMSDLARARVFAIIVGEFNAAIQKATSNVPAR